MLGKTHAVLGAAAAAGVGRLVGLPPATLFATVGVAAGAALVADLDEPGSTVSTLAAPLSSALSTLTNGLAGGHRYATHSLFAVAAVTTGTWLLGHVALCHTTSAAIIPGAIALILAVRGLVPGTARHGHITTIALGVAGSVLVAEYVGTGTWITLAIAGGWTTHIVGDFVTPAHSTTNSGVALAWPSRRRYGIAVLGCVGSAREHLAAAVLSVATITMLWTPAAALIGH